MANKVRERESVIMQAIFENHPLLKNQMNDIFSISEVAPNIFFEGGDILIAREDIIIIGLGKRTSSQGIDSIIHYFTQKRTKPLHILIQELPSSPESFFHLDMAFTFLDRNQCMAFEPLILKANHYRTIHVTIDNGKVKTIKTIHDLIGGLKSLGMDLQTLFCGGRHDTIIQEREQWHSGANFFALAPGIVIGYSRNTYTAEELNKNGFETMKASEVLEKNINTANYKKLLITIEGAELSRGGGGARCMTLPLSRKNVE